MLHCTFTEYVLLQMLHFFQGKLYLFGYGTNAFSTSNYMSFDYSMLDWTDEFFIGRVQC